jgi:nitronate monooxygenase
MGADRAYIGSAFIATDEARASEAYKQMVVDSTSDDIVYTKLFTGVPGNYLKESIRKEGMDPDSLPDIPPTAMNFAGPLAKAWKDIWGAGQGVGAIDRIEPTAARVARWEAEFRAARERLCMPSAAS